MTDRRKVLEQFEKQKDFMKDRVQSGIESYRKGNAGITVKDRDGNPVSNVKIRVTQKNHEFKFGANLFMLDELETDEKNRIYKQRFADVFNMATLPFYWDATEPERGKTRYEKDSEKLYRRPPIDLCLEFCEQNNIEPREHALAYEHFFPDWLKEATVFEAKAQVQKRFSQIAERYRDRIPTIEVTNEMEWDEGKTVLYNQPDYIEWCFKTAETYFPANQLVVNEWTGLPWGDRCRTSDKYYSYIEANLLKGARIDAIGMQFHMFYSKEEEYRQTRPYYDPGKLYAHMDLYSNFAKPLQVTEVTIPAYSNDPEDEAIQAELIEYLYSIWFSHPNMEQIIYWNLVDGYAAFAKQGDMTQGENYYYGGLLRFDMTPKPAYYTIKNLIEKKWYTEETIITDESGTAGFRGFYGMYELELTVDKKVITKEICLRKNGINQFEISC